MTYNYDDIVKLERHKYAPEMNKLHMRDGRTISTPGQTRIRDAWAYAIRNHAST